MFHSLLEHHFENQKGHYMVLRQEYALEENCTGEDIDRSRPWSASFRRGMKVNMSMVFTDISIVNGCCPRCKTAAEAPDDLSVQW